MSIRKLKAMLSVVEAEIVDHVAKLKLPDPDLTALLDRRMKILSTLEVLEGLKE